DRVTFEESRAGVGSVGGGRATFSGASLGDGRATFSGASLSGGHATFSGDGSGVTGDGPGLRSLDGRSGGCGVLLLQVLRPVVDRQGGHLPALLLFAVEQYRADQALGLPDPRAVVHPALILHEDLQHRVGTPRRKDQGASLLATIQHTHGGTITE